VLASRLKRHRSSRFAVEKTRSFVPSLMNNKMSSKADDDHTHLRRPINKSAITQNLHTHYEKNLIFSAIGSTISLSLNPRKQLDSTSDAVQQLYLAHAHDTTPDRLPLPEHLFSLADRVYLRMVEEEQDQAIILRYERMFIV
jgi:myosin heavy subunit